MFGIYDDILKIYSSESLDTLPSSYDHPDLSDDLIEAYLFGMLDPYSRPAYPDPDFPEDWL